MRNVPAALQSYMMGNGIHMTRVCRMGPFPDDSYKGFAFLDINIEYDAADGIGEITYYARTGAQMTDFVGTTDLSVSNAEMQTLQPVDAFPIEGITTEEIQKGDIDGVPFVVFALNYKDLTPGRHFIWSGGTIGEVRQPGTAILNLEQRSITNKLLQTIGDVDSTTCRALRLGTQYLGTNGGVMEELHPCLYDVSVENISAAITGVDSSEPDLIFQDTTLAQAENYFAPGTVLFTSGDNIGIEREIEAFELGVILLKHALPKPAQVGDEFRIRRECTLYPIGHNSCVTFWGSQWILHFRGEPYIPVGDAAANLTPGAAVPTDIGGTGEPLPTNDPGTNPDPEPGGGGAGNSSAVSATSRTHGATVVDPVSYGLSSAASAATNTAAYNAAIAALPGDGGIIRPSTSGPFTINPGQIFIPSNTFVDHETHDCVFQSAFTTTDRRSMFEIRTESEVEFAGGELIGMLGLGTIPAGLFERCHGIAVFGSSAVTIRDLTVRNCVGDGISVGVQTTGVRPDDVIIDNVLSTGNYRQGFTVGRSDNVTVQNCEGSYTSGTSPQAGIDVEPDNPDTQNSTNTQIINCWFHHNTGPGILCYRSADDVTASGNTLEYNSIGVSSYQTNNLEITGNTIRHNRNHGVKLQDTTTNAVVNSNTFWDNSTGSTPATSYTSSTNITGMTSATADDINKTSTSTASVGSNTYLH